jgi:hypothetical protein
MGARCKQTSIQGSEAVPAAISTIPVTQTSPRSSCVSDLSYRPSPSSVPVTSQPARSSPSITARQATEMRVALWSQLGSRRFPRRFRCGGALAAAGHLAARACCPLTRARIELMSRGGMSRHVRLTASALGHSPRTEATSVCARLTANEAHLEGSRVAVRRRPGETLRERNLRRGKVRRPRQSEYAL